MKDKNENMENAVCTPKYYLDRKEFDIKNDKLIGLIISVDLQDSSTSLIISTNNNDGMIHHSN
uniref:Uncharacterized protein n=1 Tax=Onchocerca volvulus TaxID=6282 RepID=A0A8R1Y0U2_ONCVO